MTLYHPTHEMVQDEYGVDIWRYEVGHHNGPECLRCGKWCHHCDSERARQPCPNSASPTVTEPVSVPEPSTVDSGCSSKGEPSVCIHCDTVLWHGGLHVNGQVECDMWQVPGV